jgi:phosphodiesterase/alkaline phosphatase D-like protein
MKILFSRFYTLRVFLLLCILTILSACEQPQIEKSIQRIVFGSCAIQWMEQPIWNSISDTKPDLFLFIGDAIYGDWDGENVFDVTDETLERD